ncbi:NAD-dependent epimerase/dehydratase family protein [Dictyobacter aurantiacus]|uniref:Epimerase n=1 Tax=Dictyobacter aurantiacus TaxID=1936993 RepID=A0A401ZT38_9CHLR|nr:NAD-dependent epimerase/dehydratase family protein [Dictyobacter aurantiacus]GCE09956.1 epimerase [Dictyobacter aurantiacus]
MRVLIIGGTRFMGPYVVEKLSEAGHELSIFHRGKTKTKLPDGVKELLGDRDRLSEYAGELRQLAPEVVLDMMVATEQHARDLMVTFTGAARRIVVVSSQDVYRAFGRVNRKEDGDVDPAPITEESPLRKNLYPYRGEMLRTDDDPQRWMDDYDKILAERVIMSHPELPSTILRLPAVYGPHDPQHRMFLYLKRMLDGRQSILLEEGEARWRWTHGYVENVADAIALAVTSEQTAGRIYNVGESFALSVAERIEHIAKVIKWQGRIVILPAECVPEKLRWGINTAQDVVANTSRIRQELGYSERIDVDEAFRRTIAWEREHFPVKVDSDQFDYATEDKALAQAEQ